MTRESTQIDRVLRALRSGPVAATDFAAPNVRDGGKPIMRVASRVLELREQGYLIFTTRRPNGVAVYQLASPRDGAGNDAPCAPAAVCGVDGPVSPAVDAALFDTNAYTQRGRSHYDEQEAA